MSLSSWFLWRLRRNFGAMLSAIAIALLCCGTMKPAAADPEAVLEHYRVGVWVESLYDFNAADKSFSTTMWLWSLTEDKTHEPLKTMEFNNAAKYEVLQPFLIRRGNIYWRQCLVKGKFHYGWDLSNFPFDRHDLIITINESVEDTNTFVYEADTINSTYSDKIHLDGWNITGFETKVRPVKFNTTFGDPSLVKGSTSEYSQLTVTISIARSSYEEFFEMTFIVYISFGISLLSYFLSIDNFDSRLNLLVGALFATAINMMSANSALGNGGFTLVGKIHILTLSYILLGTIVAIVSKRAHSQDYPAQRLKRIDARLGMLAFLTYFLLNSMLVAAAMRAIPDH